MHVVPNRRGLIVGAVAQAALVSPALPSPAPTPIAVFVAFLRANQTPPDLVIVCAAAEAEMAGNATLARQIADRYPDVLARRVEIMSALAPPPPPAALAAPAPAQTPAPANDTPAPAPAPVLTPSPIEGVTDEQWRALCEQLVRGDASYTSERRIGRYHHRKDRLREIGFDPESLLGAAEAQDIALSADMADVWRHLHASGEIAKQIGRPISIPDVAEPVPITLSGLFGVATVAGLEDMTEWLSSKADRKKFVHTTAAFLRVNGIF